MTKLGLEFLQISANRNEVERRCSERQEELNKANDEFQKGASSNFSISCPVVNTYPQSTIYTARRKLM